MTDLIERYIHEFGRYLPRKDRGEIEAELRSLIQDQLDDRYGGEPTESEVAHVLTELGDPRVMAASYRPEQYLIGPEAYPYMMMVLRRVWLFVPVIVIFLHVFTLLISSEDRSIVDWLVDPVLSALQITFVFTGLVVLIFAVLERMDLQYDAFNPLELPEVDDPGRVDRFEVVTGLILAIIAMFLFLYYLRVGGLTLRFDLNNPGDVIPTSAGWTVALIGVVIGQIIMHAVALRQNRWTIGTWLVETVLEVFGVIPLYFAVLKPLVDRLLIDQPDLADVWPVANAAEIFAVSYAIITLLNRGGTLFKLWNHRHSAPPSFTVQPDR